MPGNEMRPPRKRTETRARLITAGFEALAERGYAAVSVDEICTRAGYTRGAFYSNFTTKDDLVMTVFDQYASRRAEQLRTLVSTLETERLDRDALANQLAAALLELSSEDHDLSSALLECHAQAPRDSALAARLDEHDNEAVLSLAHFLTRIVPSDSTLADFPPNEAAAFLLALRAGTLTRIRTGGQSARDTRRSFHLVLRELVGKRT